MAASLVETWAVLKVLKLVASTVDMRAYLKVVLKVDLMAALSECDWAVRKAVDLVASLVLKSVAGWVAMKAVVTADH